jgi:hypothetical protein
MSAPTAIERRIACSVFSGPSPSPPAWAMTFGGDDLNGLCGHEFVGPPPAEQAAAIKVSYATLRCARPGVIGVERRSSTDVHRLGDLMCGATSVFS